MKVLWDKEHKTKIVNMVIDILNKGKNPVSIPQNNNKKA